MTCRKMVRDRQSFINKLYNIQNKRVIIKLNTPEEEIYINGFVSRDENVIFINGTLKILCIIYTGIISINENLLNERSSFLSCINMINVKVSYLPITIKKLLDMYDSRICRNLDESSLIGKYSIIDNQIIFTNPGDFLIFINYHKIMYIIPKTIQITFLYEFPMEYMSRLYKYRINTLSNLENLKNIFESSEFRSACSRSESINIFFSSNFNVIPFHDNDLNNIIIHDYCYIDFLNYNIMNKFKIRYLGSLNLNLSFDTLHFDENMVPTLSSSEWYGEPGTTHVNAVVDYEYSKTKYKGCKDKCSGSDCNKDFKQEQQDKVLKEQFKKESCRKCFVNCKGEIPSNVVIETLNCNELDVHGLPIPWKDNPTFDEFKPRWCNMKVFVNLKLAWKEKPKPYSLKAYHWYDQEHDSMCPEHREAKPIYGVKEIKHKVSGLEDIKNIEQKILQIMFLSNICFSFDRHYRISNCFTPSLNIDSSSNNINMCLILYKLMFQRETIRHLHTKNARYMLDYLRNKKMKELLLNRMNYIRVKI